MSERYEKNESISLINSDCLTALKVNGYHKSAVPKTLIKNKVYLDGKPLVEVNEDLPKNEQDKVNKYLSAIYDIIKHGNCPAIISVYDKKEAGRLERLRDKDRQER